MGSRRSAPSFVQVWTGRFNAWVHGSAARMIARGIVGTAFVIAAVVALQRLESWTQAFAASTTPSVRIQWAEVPDWLRQSENQHIFDDLIACSGLTVQDTLSDSTIAQRVGRALSDPQVGWIRRVHRVIKQPPDRLIIHCDFRQPVAWVEYGAHAYLVDNEGVRLPGRYPTQSTGASGLLDVIGVRERPPEVGSLWGGADAAAALSVVRMVDRHAFSSQIIGVSVENFGARLTRTRPQIELLTDRPGSRVWWGRAPGAEDATEISAADKVDLLNSLYQRWGRVDMNRTYIDITTWSNKVALPAAADPESNEPTLRG